MRRGFLRGGGGLAQISEAWLWRYSNSDHALRTLPSGRGVLGRMLDLVESRARPLQELTPGDSQRTPSDRRSNSKTPSPSSSDQRRRSRRRPITGPAARTAASPLRMARRNRRLYRCLVALALEARRHGRRPKLVVSRPARLALIFCTARLYTGVKDYYPETDIEIAIHRSPAHGYPSRLAEQGQKARQHDAILSSAS